MNRDLKKARHRLLLIEATIATIAESGITGATVSNIVARAGLSRGMVHLHFRNKEELLIEAAKHFAEDYFDKLRARLERAGAAPKDRLEALIEADLSEELLNETSIVVWYALRGEARKLPGMMQYTTTRDAALRDMFARLFLECLGGHAGDAARARDLAVGTIALLEGMWADYFLFANSFNRQSAARIIKSLVLEPVA